MPEKNIEADSQSHPASCAVPGLTLANRRLLISMLNRDQRPWLGTEIAERGRDGGVAVAKRPWHNYIELKQARGNQPGELHLGDDAADSDYRHHWWRGLHRLTARKSFSPVIKSLVAEAATATKGAARNPALLLLPDQFRPLLLPPGNCLDSSHPSHYRAPCGSCAFFSIAERNPPMSMM